MKVLGVIPSRYGSTRFPGKPLALISGKPLLQWVVEGARQSQTLSDVIVATDNKEIAELARKIDVKCVMTDSELPSGSDRVWAAIKDIDCDVAINIQGDEPLISGELVDSLAAPFLEDTDLDMATLGRKLSKDDLESTNTAKIVLNHKDEALYFSRYPIPFSRNSFDADTNACLKHIGMYGYSKFFLQRFCEFGPVEVELAESLEQLRALYLGARIKVVKVNHESWGVDHPEDVEKIEKLLNKR